MRMLQPLQFDTRRIVGARARIGLIVLASDYTIEHEFRSLLVKLDGVDFFVARILNDDRITPGSLASMGQRIGQTTELLLPGASLDVIGYGCTSATAVLGEAVVFDAIRAVKPEALCTTPLSAAFAAFEKLQARKVGLLTPYRQDVNEVLARQIQGRGFDVPVFGSFNEPHDSVVAEITVDSVSRAVQQLRDSASLDMVFVSCTSIRILSALAAIEALAGVPVCSSNQVLAWHCLRLAGIDDRIDGHGCLLSD